MDTQTGRPLSEAELAVLRHILSAPFAGAGQLRQQLAVARVAGNWAPPGSPSIDIFVPAAGAAADVPDGPAPVAAQVIDGNGNYLGELLLWVTGGRISGLEYSWVTDEVPSRLPDTSWIQLTPASV
jgi:hypothetical protein